MKLTQLNKYSDKKVAILGFGKEGKSSLDFLLKLSFSNLTILDINKNLEQQNSLNYELGESYLDNLSNYELIIKSPGVSPYNEKVKPYTDKLTTQAQIFTDNYKGKIIGITGTKGKSTTSTVLFLALQNAGYDTKIVGNIGNPVLDEVDILSEEIHDYIVYEMSSYMLEGLKSKLYIGFINNIYNCHFDWHLGKENYENAKLNILKYSENKIANIESKSQINGIDNISFFGTGTNYVYSDKEFKIENKTVLKDENIILEGDHNRINIVGIISILNQIKTDKQGSKGVFSKLINGLKMTLSNFSGLPHRIQNIGTYKGITFIDDAIATTPESTIAAIRTFDHNIGTLFLGGQDSGFSFDKLRDEVMNHKIKNIVLFPDSGELIFGDLSKYKYEESFILEINNHKLNVLKTRFMKYAVDFAFANTGEGKICLLSNASPSFSLWSGYIEKGIQFQTEVKNHDLK